LEITITEVARKGAAKGEGKKPGLVVEKAASGAELPSFETSLDKPT
jgi:hypothetical protein